MSPGVIGIIGLCLLFVLIFMKMPVGLAMATVGLVGFAWVRGLAPGLSLLGVEYYRTASTYAFSVIPFFVALGFLASAARLSEDGFKTINDWVGHLPGGLAMAATGACGIFAAICGDAIATSITVAAVSLPEMRKRNYSDVLSLGCLAASGNLGFLIPPSLGFIVYAIFTEQAVGTLFIAGIVPGILLTIIFMMTIWIQCRINPSLAPASSAASWRERFTSLRHITGSAILIALVLGGIYVGIFTPTEAGAVGVFGVLVLGLASRRLSWGAITGSLLETARLTGRIFILVIGAIVLSRFVTVTEVPLHLAELITSLSVSPYVVLAMVLVFYILIGFIMDIMSVVVIVAPILHPILVGLGFDPVWLGVITMVTILIGQITPPVGIVVYGLSGFVTDVSVWQIFRGSSRMYGQCCSAWQSWWLFHRYRCSCPTFRGSS